MAEWPPGVNDPRRFGMSVIPMEFRPDTFLAAQEPATDQAACGSYNCHDNGNTLLGRIVPPGPLAKRATGWLWQLHTSRWGRSSRASALPHVQAPKSRRSYRSVV